LLLQEKVILIDMNYELEVIAFDIDSCKIAADNGADRIEVCANPAEGGTTPSSGMIREARKATTIQVFPIIRPRGGDFLYSNTEFNVMLHDIKFCRDEGCDGVVIGMLNPDGTIDSARCAALIDAAGNMEVTFHRAFDRVAEPFSALEEIINLGCKRILTSGLRPKALEGKDTLCQLTKIAGDRIKIMPGSGIRASNISTVVKATGALAYHSSARQSKASDMLYNNLNMNELFSNITIDGNEVKLLRQELDKLTMTPAL
jgi:copper homeostasis protein